MSQLVSLAERCGAASGPNRQLDVAIAEAVGWRDGIVASIRTGSPLNDAAAMADDADRGGYLRGLPKYTRSIDAAMTLIPDRWSRYINDADNFQDCIIELSNEDTDEEIVLRARTWPLAICAASLRARSAIEGTGE